MTAEEVRGVVFQKAAIGGYKQSDVDMFLDEVAVCIESMTAKIRSLEKAKFDAGAARPHIIDTPKPSITPETTKEEKNDTITDYGLQSLLIRAQQLADQIQNEAKEAADQLLEKTTEDAKEIIAEAKSNLELYGIKTYLLLDECHRWSKSQSDCVLEAIEKGYIVFTLYNL